MLFDLNICLEIDGSHGPVADCDLLFIFMRRKLGFDDVVMIVLSFGLGRFWMT
jgi:hypothetical protein